MTRYILGVVGGALVCMLALGGMNLAVEQAPGAGEQTAPMSLEAQGEFIAEYCSHCHNPVDLFGGMTLTNLDFAHPEQNAELAEKVVGKVKAGLMPPAGEYRPEKGPLDAFASAIEIRLDEAAAEGPNPGTRGFQRLTRDEYANSIKHLLGVEVDVAKYLPADMLSEGMDNIADSQPLSASLMEGYMRAAGEITNQALGDPNATPTSVMFKATRLASQLEHVPGTPFGTRGGMSVMHNFPADGEYDIRFLLFATATGRFFANVEDEEVEVSLDGERIALLEVDPEMTEADETGLNLTTGRLFVKAGPHRVAVAFVNKHSPIVEDDIREIAQTMVDSDAPNTNDLTIYAHLREFEISGPFNVSGVSDSAPRRAVFNCRPLSPAEETPCAREIIRALARKAYRRPVTDEDMEGLMLFYGQGREKGGDFESGIRSALHAMLTSPYFVFKFEVPPTDVAAGQSYYVGDLALASRLSYFVWGTPPDDELVDLADQGRLQDPVVLEAQVRSMLADPRSIWLSEKFANLWLHLPDLMNIEPDPFYFPFYDHTLALALEREAELFFDSVVREDRNVLDLITADDTFVNERLADHYGIPNVRGGQFRRVTVADDYRRGLLGKGAILTMTSNADRTSPVLRGKWVLQVLLGTDPPPPPPVVPSLEETEAVDSGKVLTVRERMQSHRANPACSSCHRMIDPLGLALENFDVTGRWRTWDKTFALDAEGLRIHSAGIPIDSTTELYDGTPLDGPATLRQGILKYSDTFIQGLTQKLMSFAIGRRIEYFDMPAIRTITREAALNDNRFSSLILGIVDSPPFQMNTEAEPVTEARER